MYIYLRSLWCRLRTELYSFLSQNMCKPYLYRHNATLRVSYLSGYVKMPRLGTNIVWVLLSWHFTEVIGISVNRPRHNKCLFKRVFRKFVFSRNDPPPLFVSSVLCSVLRRCSSLREIVTLFPNYLIAWWNNFPLPLLTDLYFWKYFI